MEAQPLIGSHDEHKGEQGEDAAGRRMRAPWRDLAAFWLFGLTNNFPYVIMLSAANDILQEIDPSLGTGIILLADILPDLLLKSTVPFVVQRLGFPLRVLVVVFVSASSYIVVALSRTTWLSLLGVACASISSGLGEMTFLGLTSHYHPNTIAAWSSGTGGAGVLGALSYLLFTLFLSPSHALLVMLVASAAMAASFWLVLTPSPVRGSLSGLHTHHPREREKAPRIEIPLKTKIKLIGPLLRFMIPLVLVYLAEYLINQGIYENVYWTDEFIDKDTQYRVFQTLYQVGVFVSRSSVTVFPIDRIWIPAVLQCVNVVLLALDCRFKVIPYIWIWFAIILYEGLLGGAAYVNAFRLISVTSSDEHREFSMGVGTMASSIGIALAGAAAVGVHQDLKGVGGRTK